DPGSALRLAGITSWAECVATSARTPGLRSGVFPMLAPSDGRSRRCGRDFGGCVRALPPAPASPDSIRGLLAAGAFGWEVPALWPGFRGWLGAVLPAPVSPDSIRGLPATGTFECKVPALRMACFVMLVTICYARRRRPGGRGGVQVAVWLPR